MTARLAATLAGRRVAVTRAPGQARELLELLRSRGAEPVACATIDIAAPIDGYAALDEVVRSIDRYDWVAFTSQNAVRAFADRAATLGIALPATTRLAAVGGVTARAASERLRPVDFVPSSTQAESLAAEMEGVVNRRVLFPRGDLAGDTVGRVLRSRGATVDEVVAYRTIPGSGTRELAEMVRGGDVDAILFMSASSVRHLLDALDLGGAAQLAARTRAVICIGPETARAARDAGVEVSAVATDRTASGVVDALEGWFRERGERDDGTGT
jgi:uroporphyrinogen-III synthase